MAFSDFAAHPLAMAHGVAGFGTHGVARQRALGSGHGADVGTLAHFGQRVIALGLQGTPTFYLNYETALVKDFVDAAGPRFSVVLPPRLPDGTRSQGVAIDL